MNTQRNKRRARPDERNPNPRPMREGENDRRIVRYLYHYGVLSQKQFEQLLERTHSTVQQLLRRLYDHYYVHRLYLPVTRFGTGRTLYVLDRQGIALLRRMGIEDFSGLPGKNLKYLFLYHSLAISEVHLAIEKACLQYGGFVDLWLNDNRLRSQNIKILMRNRGRSKALVPDSYFSLTIPNVVPTRCFLELDRGTMDLQDFRMKVEAYIRFYKSGEFGRRYGADGFRVLTVVDGVGETRVKNLLEAVGSVPSIGRRFWITHIKHITPQTVLSAPIWRIAGSTENASLVSL